MSIKSEYCDKIKQKHHSFMCVFLHEVFVFKSSFYYWLLFKILSMLLFKTRRLLQYGHYSVVFNHDKPSCSRAFSLNLDGRQMNKKKYFLVLFKIGVNLTLLSLFLEYLKYTNPHVSDDRLLSSIFSVTANLSSD